jgi:hypothetical protein
MAATSSGRATGRLDDRIGCVILSTEHDHAAQFSAAFSIRPVTIRTHGRNKKRWELTFP